MHIYIEKLILNSKIKKICNCHINHCFSPCSQIIRLTDAINELNLYSDKYDMVSYNEKLIYFILKSISINTCLKNNKEFYFFNVLIRKHSDIIYNINVVYKNSHNIVTELIVNDESSLLIDNKTIIAPCLIKNTNLFFRFFFDKMPNINDEVILTYDTIIINKYILTNILNTSNVCETLTHTYYDSKIELINI